MNFGGGHGGRGGFTEDDLKARIYDKRLYGRMLRYLKPYLKWVVISFVILMVVALAELVQPLIQRSAIDDYVVSDKTIAVFTDKAELDAFKQQNQILKLKDYSHGGRHFVILSAKAQNRIDRPVLRELEVKGILSVKKVFLIEDKPEYAAILNKYLRENTAPQPGQDGIPGWFRIGGARSPWSAKT